MASRFFSPSTARLLARQPVAAPMQRLAVPKRFNSSSSASIGKDPLLEEQAHAKDHAAKSAELWRKLSFYVCLPGAAVIAVYIYQIETAHIQHRDHDIAANGGELPEEGKPKHEYQNIRKKAFPWGQQAIFFNPKANYPSEEM